MRKKRTPTAAGLTWQDINFKEQCLTVRRSIRYSNVTYKHEIGSTKRKKVRIVDFGIALADILKKARKQQLKNRMQYGELCHRNFYKEVSTTMNVYAHATREAKRESAKLSDKVVGMN